MARRTRHALGVGVCVALVASLSSAVRAQAILETPTSHIELIGLHRWTLRMIEDSLAVYSPKEPLTAHACAAILRGKLHFADASVVVFMNFDKSDANKTYTAITVVEPQDSARIHYKAFKYDSIPVRREWASAFALFTSERMAQTSIQTPAFFASALSPDDSARFATVSALRAVIVQHRQPSDFDLARKTLETDPAYANRVIAAVILANFPDRDDTWLTLADALRDPVGMVSSTAGQVLGMMTKSAPRPIDWAPIAPSLRAIVDGTNLFGFDRLMTTLTATKVNPSLAPALLGGGGDIVRAKLLSSAPGVKDAVSKFVVQVSGLLATADAATLSRWTEGVPTPGQQHRAAP